MSTVWDTEEGEVETPAESSAPAETTTKPELPLEPTTPEEPPQTTSEPETPTSEEARATEDVSAEDVEIPEQEVIHSSAIDERFSNSPKGARDYIKRLTETLEGFGGRQNIEDAQKVIQTFLDPTADMADLDATLNELSPSQRNAYGWHLATESFRANPDPMLQHLFGKGVTVDSVRKALSNTAPQPEPTDYQADNGEISEYELSLIPEELRPTIQSLVKDRERLAALETEFPQLKKEVTDFKTQQEQERTQTLETNRKQLEEKLYSKVYTKVVEKGLDDLRLKPIEGDSEEMIKLKRLAAKQIVNNIDTAFEGRDEGKALLSKVAPFIERLEEHNVFREEDAFIFQADQALKTLIESDDVKPILDQINALARSKSDQLTRERPKELIGGTAAPPKVTDDIVRGKGVDAIWALDE